MIRAVGDNAFVDDENGGAALHDASGVVRRWDDARGVALLEDPPRLAIARQNRGIGAMGIELVDVATGETERRIELGFTRVVAFAPDGNALLAQRGDGLFLVDGNGSGARIEGAPAGDYGPAFFDERGSFALCVFRAHSGARPAAELMRIHAGNKRMSWVSTPSQSVLDFVVDVRVTRCAALCAAFAPDRPSANDVREVTVGNARNFEESTSIDFAVRGAHACSASRSATTTAQSASTMCTR